MPPLKLIKSTLPTTDYCTNDMNIEADPLISCETKIDRRFFESVYFLSLSLSVIVFLYCSVCIVCI